jgi:hypothetical protein
MLPAMANQVADGRGTGDRRTLAGLYAEFAADIPDGFERWNGCCRRGRSAADGRQSPSPAGGDGSGGLAAAGRWDRVWPLLRHAPDPTVRSYLVERLATFGVEARALMDRLGPEQEPDVSARRALLLALGDFSEDRLPAGDRGTLVPRLLGWYRDDPDPGTRSAAGWLLRRWGQQDGIAAIDRELAAEKEQGQRRWYVNGPGQTMVHVAPGELEIGAGERRKTIWLRQGFALSAREVTVAEFLRFRKNHRIETRSAPTPDCPVNEVSWYDAAAYCNWLSNEEGIAEDQWCYVRNEKGQYARNEGEGQRGEPAGVSIADGGGVGVRLLRPGP